MEERNAGAHRPQSSGSVPPPLTPTHAVAAIPWNRAAAHVAAAAREVAYASAKLKPPDALTPPQLRNALDRVLELDAKLRALPTGDGALAEAQLTPPPLVLDEACGVVKMTRHVIRTASVRN